MQKIQITFIAALLAFGLTACGKNNGTDSSASGEAQSGSDAKMVEFVTTQDGKPLEIKAAQFDTAAAKEFMTTGKNPYIGNEEAVQKGKKLFQLYSCTQCHGGDGQGQTGPSLHGPDYKYPKDTTNKGMFETIWHGTNGGMGAKGKGLMDPSDPNNGLTVDEALKIIAWIRTHGTTTGNE
jgi:cytochrome c-L